MCNLQTNDADFFLAFKAAPGEIDSIGTVPTPESASKAKAEGVAVYHRDGNKLDAVVVSDGVEKGSPPRFPEVLP
jgi:hypothetical protein